MNHRTTVILIFLISVFLNYPAAAADDVRFPDRKALQEFIARFSYLEGNQSLSVSMDQADDVARFYRLLGYRQAWSGPDGLLPNGTLLLNTIANASDAGLGVSGDLLPLTETALIDFAHMADDLLIEGIAPFIQLDIILTDSIIRYARQLHQGRVTPDQIYGPWLAQRRSATRDIVYELAQSVIIDRFSAYIESLHPQSEAYQRLRSALRQYEAIRRRGGWLPIDAGPVLRPGDRGPRVAMLKYRLRLTGDDGLNQEPIDNDRFDDRVTRAVKQFQRRHGLNADGRVGSDTLAELNIPVDHRIRQLQLSMERWRWFPDSFGDRYIMVNIPAFELVIVDSGNITKRIRVVVGKKDRQTPVMSDQMTYIEFNPYWNIPQNIARKDILPKIKHDLTYLINQGIRVFDSWERQAQELDPTGIDWAGLSEAYFPYRLRQDPSGHNALGQIKFMFPNSQSIYIHDTPGKTLFNRQERAFSSGCVRIEEPITLAAHLLGEQGWNRHQLESVTAGERPKSVILASPIPVHLVYFTAWADEKQTVHFRRDIYGRDEILLAALQHQTSDRMADNESSTIKSLLSIFMRDDQQNDKPPGDGPEKEKTVLRPVFQSDSDLWQTGSGDGNDIRQADEWAMARRPTT